MTRLVAPTKRPVTVRLTPPSAAEEQAYSRRLARLVDAMAKDVEDAVLGAYREAHPDLVGDADPLKAALKRLQARWNKAFDDAASSAAGAFAKGAGRHADVAFAAALKKAGFGVKFQMTDAMRRASKKIVSENVRLIKSIPRQHLADVRRLVEESVSSGRDLHGLAARLVERHGVTRRRAALIARDQNNKASALLNRVRQAELGLGKARWRHTGGSLHPRQEHMEWDGQVYDVDTGMYSDEDGEFVWPGTPVNCGCLSDPIIPGYDDDEEQPAAGPEIPGPQEEEVGA